jgi:hypothetical protein
VSDYRDYVAAARTIRKANAMLGNGDKCAWTADDLFDLASSVAADQDIPGRCPMCATRVLANSSARIAKHVNNLGKVCTASGDWFHIAVEPA